MEQLNDSIEQNIRQEFKEMLVKDYIHFSDNPKDMSSKYLQKLIPTNRRCFLPQLDIRELNIIFNNEIYIGEQNIEDIILEKINLLTGLIMLKKPYNRNFFIPSNLREFIHFYKFLNDLSKNDSQLINLHKFKSYFLNVWIFNVLDKLEIGIINELNSTDVREKNKFIILQLVKTYKKFFKKQEIISDDFIINEITNPINNPQNISFGDLLAIMNYAERIFIDRSDKIFLFAIKLYYSILMTEFYLSDDRRQLEKVIGENIYNEDYVNLVSRSLRNNEKRDYWFIEYNKITSDIDTSNDIQLAISLFIIRMRKQIERTSQDINYLYPLLAQGTNVVFSLLGFIRNSYFIESHIGRLNGKLDLNYKDSNSLIYKLYSNQEPLIPFYSWDVVEKIIFEMRSNRLKIKYANSYYAILRHVIIKTVPIILEDIETITNGNLKLIDNYLQSPLIEVFSDDEFGKKVDSIYSREVIKVELTQEEEEEIESLISEIKEHYTHEELLDIQAIATSSLNYYRQRYFTGEIQSSQGAKMAMNNLRDSFFAYEEILQHLYDFRLEMNDNLLKGLKSIEYYLDLLSQQ